MLGPDCIPVDRLVRTIGLPRMTAEHMKHMIPEEQVALENYAAGINKVAENMVVYPPEF